MCLALSDPHVGRVAPKTLVDEVVIQSWSWFAWQKRLVLARRVARYMAKVHSTQDITGLTSCGTWDLLTIHFVHRLIDLFQSSACVCVCQTFIGSLL